MALPSFISTRRTRTYPSVSRSTLKSATRTRLLFALFTSFCFLISLTFLILVEVGNISSRRPVVGSIWFFKLDLSEIIPQTFPNAVLINSIARTLGLHDFYQVGLWNFCEGYGNQITSCSKPRRMYWFNPVEIIINELLSGATIALPNDILTALGLVRHASHWMFALFLTAAPLSFLSIFLTPLSIYSRLLSLPIAILAFLSALTTTAACIIATALFIIFRNVITSQGADINIRASVGTKMFAFMWVAAAGAIIGWLVQMGMCCCCASRRDVTKGKKVGRRSAYKDGEVPVHDQMQQVQGGGRKRGWLGRKKD